MLSTLCQVAAAPENILFHLSMILLKNLVHYNPTKNGLANIDHITATVRCYFYQNDRPAAHFPLSAISKLSDTVWKPDWYFFLSKILQDTQTTFINKTLEYYHNMDTNTKAFP